MFQINLSLLKAEANVVKEEDLVNFEWYTFEGKRKKTVTRRTHVRDVVPGQVYGLRAKRGGDYYLILPDLWHVPFNVSSREGQNLLAKSKKKRKAPRLGDPRSGRVRAVRANKDKKVDTSSDRYKPERKVRAERNGIDLSNYQWRVLSVPVFKVKKTNKIGVDLVKRQIFGVRFIKPATGGVLVLEDGKRFGLKTEDFDSLMQSSNVLPLTKWRTETLSLKDIENNKAVELDKKQKAKQKAAAERKALREQREAKKKAEALKVRKAVQKEKEEQRQKMEALRKGAHATENAVYSPVVSKDPISTMIENVRDKNKEELLKSMDDLADDDVELDIDDLEVTEPDPEDETIAEDEIEIADADQDAVDSALDEQIKEAKDEARSVQILDDDDEDEIDFDAEDEDNEYEAPDLDSMDEQEVIELADELGLGKLKYERALSAVQEYYGLDAEEDEDDDGTLEEQNEEAAIDEALDSEEDETDEEEMDDSSEPTDEEDPDSEDEQPPEESENTETEEEEQPTFEEGTVIVFNKDETEQRNFVILDIYPLKKNDNIEVYKVYDIDADDETYRTVRTIKGKTSIQKMAKFVKQLGAKQFAEIYSRMETFEKNSDPITS